MTQKLIQQIRSFSLKYPHKKIYTDACIDLIQKFDDNTAFLRNCFDDGHFTGSVLVINPERTKVLLMHHVKFGTWQQFGGHADGEVDLRNVAIRELEEESGIIESDAEISEDIFYIDRHTVYAHKGEPEHFHYDVGFLAVADESTQFTRAEEEVHDIQWFDITQVKSQLDSGKYSSGLCRMIENI